MANALDAGMYVSVALAATGYLMTYVNGVRLDIRKSRLNHLNDQIQYLYGPMFSLTQATNAAWESFSARHRPGQSFFDSGPLSPDELAAWRMWMNEVFMPMNVKMEATIIANAHLIEGKGMPDDFLKLLSHVEEYKVVMAQWKAQDYSRHTAYLPFPPELRDHVSATFNKLTDEQSQLHHAMKFPGGVFDILFHKTGAVKASA